MFDVVKNGSSPTIHKNTDKQAITSTIAKTDPRQREILQTILYNIAYLQAFLVPTRYFELYHARPIPAFI